VLGPADPFRLPRADALVGERMLLRPIRP
jgi:hypothetical protein